ncbi:MAG: CpsB/CapC family capsule biosynthesis tyrosine phosphatase [Syntrophotaleaceae bacterium]
MVDIHCHILPGVDDGPEELRHSLQMAEMAAADGIARIVATPHVKDDLLSPGFLSERIREFRENLRMIGSPLEMYLGADVSSALPPNIQARYTINRGPYFLLEFPHSHLPRNAEQIVFSILLAQLRPIITHPERNPSIIREPDLLFRLVEAGALVQVTAGSLTGLFGVDANHCTRYLLKKKMVHFIATDAHSPRHRRPVLSKAVEEAASIIGKPAALALVTANPKAVLEGRPLDE